MKNILTITLFSLSLIACNNEPKTEQVKDEVVIEQKETVEQLFTVPQPILDSLLKKTTSVEGTMYNSGSSFSLSDEKSAKMFVGLITKFVPSSNSKNQVGHLMFLNNGDKILICSVYMNEKQVFARFDIEGKTYYNLLTGQASDMFTNVQVRPKE